MRVSGISLHPCAALKSVQHLKFLSLCGSRQWTRGSLDRVLKAVAEGIERSTLCAQLMVQPGLGSSSADSFPTRNICGRNNTAQC